MIGPKTGWAPRLAQESRLAELDALVTQRYVGDDPLLLAIERAALLGALNRHDDAKAAFISILQKEPTHLCALNEFGALLTRMGAIAAACRVYAEGSLHHPSSPLPHINLANLLLRSSKLDEARAHYETALSLDASNPQAHQGLGAVLSDLGDRAAARLHFEKGFKDHAISRLPYRGHKPPIHLVQLVSSGGGNIPTAHLLDDTVFQTGDRRRPGGSARATAAPSAGLQCNGRRRLLRARAESGHRSRGTHQDARHQRSQRSHEDRPRCQFNKAKSRSGCRHRTDRSDDKAGPSQSAGSGDARARRFLFPDATTFARLPYRSQLCHGWNGERACRRRRKPAWRTIAGYRVSGCVSLRWDIAKIPGHDDRWPALSAPPGDLA